MRRCEEEDGTNPVDKGSELRYLMTEDTGPFGDKPTHVVADEDQACLLKAIRDTDSSIPVT
jgi:hypothetical protein